MRTARPDAGDADDREPMAEVRTATTVLSVRVAHVMSAGRRSEQTAPTATANLITAPTVTKKVEDATKRRKRRPVENMAVTATTATRQRLAKGVQGGGLEKRGFATLRVGL
ncbi:hypothetical protein PoB_002418000 [Plakobranchus ocellatus]|uniref:Uncharacterized protein n=1 Tax=Plakobranchus ocellatus TaxID=259542 RepID=A0AAV3ZST8_9GAST|nr:hypothetical protein PoB_002418000 [Plakobranchus ocellatus]